MAKINPDTLETIVAEARALEDEVNKDPSRHGLGLTPEEAAPFIRRMEWLAKREEFAQQVKASRQYHKIRTTGNDLLYHLPPDEIIEKWSIVAPINREERLAVGEFSKRQEQIYDMRCHGMTEKEIALLIGCHRNTVSRDVSKIREVLSRRLEQFRRKRED